MSVEEKDIQCGREPITLCLFFLSRALNTSPKVPCWVENHEIQMLLNVLCLHLPDLCLLFILGHFFTVGEVELLDVLVPALFNYLFVLTYIVMSYACMLVNMLGLLAVHFGVGEFYARRCI